MINAIITDFDGTLVDTFDANFCAYQKAFDECGLILEKDTYKSCFGFRFDSFMNAVGINDVNTKCKVKELKKKYYPLFFDLLKVNYPLVGIIRDFHERGVKTAIASTARRENLFNAASFLGIDSYFSIIFAGEDVKCGKPDPEIYLKTMDALSVMAEETLIFEDSEIGIQAARASGANFIKVTKDWFIK